MRKLTLLLLLFVIPLLGKAQNQLTNQHLFDTISFIPDHYAKRMAQFEKESVVKGKIMFVGNSITEGGNWQKLLNDSTVINRGISGDITFGLLKRMNDITKRQPSKLFLLIGINDIGKDIPDPVIADNVRKIIEAIKAHSPSTKVYLQSVFPVNPDYPGFPQHYNKEDQVLLLNMLLQNVAKKEKVTFINLFPIFLDKRQRMDKDFTKDGLHPNEKGYKLWINYLKKNNYL